MKKSAKTPLYKHSKPAYNIMCFIQSKNNDLQTLYHWNPLYMLSLPSLAGGRRYRYFMLRSVMECEQGRWSMCVLCNSTVLYKQKNTQRREGPGGISRRPYRDVKHKAHVAALQALHTRPLRLFDTSWSV